MFAVITSNAEATTQTNSHLVCCFSESNGKGLWNIKILTMVKLQLELGEC